MCLVDDGATAQIVRRCKIAPGNRVLDLGCGRGFLGRWLRETQTGVSYFGVDRVDEAVAAARRHVRDATVYRGDFRTINWRPNYDAVVALEIAIDGGVDVPVLDAAASALDAGGTLALTVASLNGRHDKRLKGLAATAKARFAFVELADWTERLAPFARRTYAWWLTAQWHPEIAEQCSREAKATLGALERGLFHYAVLFARK